MIGRQRTVSEASRRCRSSSTTPCSRWSPRRRGRPEAARPPARRRIARVLLFAFFLMAGINHRLEPIAEAAQSSPWITGIPEWLARFIGFAEIAGAIGVVLPAATRIKLWFTPLAAREHPDGRGPRGRDLQRGWAGTPNGCRAGRSRGRGVGEAASRSDAEGQAVPIGPGGGSFGGSFFRFPGYSAVRFCGADTRFSL
jgi:hypothetical protein